MSATFNARAKDSLSPDRKADSRVLETVAQISVGLSIGRLPEGKDSITFVQVKHVTDGGVVPIKDIDDVRDTTWTEAWEKYRIRPGDVLLTAKGSAIRVAVVEDQSAGAIATSNLLLLRPDPQRLLPEVLAAILRSPAIQKQLLDRSRSSVMAVAVSMKDVAGLTIPIPSMDTQQALQGMIAESANLRMLTQQANEQRQVMVRELVDQTIWRDKVVGEREGVSR